jgi:hypothetical protein
MKRIAILCGLIAALLCLTQNASAQYARKGANIVDKNGYVLSDSQLINVVGQNVFDQTVVGARKQYKSGKRLIWGGIVGIAAGFAGTVYSIVKLNDAGYTDVDLTSYEDLKVILDNDPSIAHMYLGSSALMSVGGTAFTAGVVLKTIGKKRLNWVEDQANAARGYSLNVGTTRNGLGLYLTF